MATKAETLRQQKVSVISATGRRDRRSSCCHDGDSSESHYDCDVFELHFSRNHTEE